MYVPIYIQDYDILLQKKMHADYLKKHYPVTLLGEDEKSPRFRPEPENNPGLGDDSVCIDYKKIRGILRYIYSVFDADLDLNALIDYRSEL